MIKGIGEIWKYFVVFWALYCFSFKIQFYIFNMRDVIVSFDIYIHEYINEKYKQIYIHIT